eukprot:m.207688 g.207688  ORF g.207688 m.207688 type:complete len:239 (-) comp32989_c10_seq1:238-954(-)
MSAKDKWLEKLDHASTIALDCEEIIETRRGHVREGKDVSKINSSIRRFLNELAMTIQDLEDLLNASAAEYHITDEQYESRQRSIDELKSRRDEMQTAYSRGQGGPTAPRSGSQSYRNEAYSQGGGRDGYDNNAYGGYDGDNAISRQEQVMRDQDDGIDVLSESIARQKNMGLAISGELDLHEDLLDDLGSAMDRTDNRLHATTERVITVTEKAKGSGMCCCIAILILAIIIVASVPGN